MPEHSQQAGIGPADLVEHLARRFIARYGADARDEIVSVIELLIEDGDFDMARLWTRVMHASSGIADRCGGACRP